jgi:hypothetical protein
VTELLLVRLISEGLKIVVGLLDGEKKEQAQEFTVDAPRGRHACRQKSHLAVAAMGVATITNLLGSGALEDLIRVVGVAVLAVSARVSTGEQQLRHFSHPAEHSKK